MDLFPTILQVQLNAKAIEAAGLEVPASVGEMAPDAALDGVIFNGVDASCWLASATCQRSPSSQGRRNSYSDP